ncbi:MAG TPA: dTMP kinase [Fimbriimonadaceae bacterium]|nr:dTMP kinase [Armatimonadota bacterium]HCM74586.1 dTMP kinase [Armatimonadota bacterium]HRD30773.1 dTMP kinase [Fimbriimonadaceae bacterium]HRE94744.1 dTMP kinase [Fimbriimonadaceae bacterium]HRI73125.1 dTMP kinase [Fimbriimonadaceae bacterium]
MFITFEGPEGGGKSTLLRTLAAQLETQGREVVCTREPGAGTLGGEIRRWLLESESLDERAELFLFLADRSQHWSQLIAPALARGAVVLCDRHADSTMVYQGYARGHDLDLLRKLNALATQGNSPTLTFLLDLDPAIGLGRAKGDRMDREPLEFHQRVREGFLTESQRDPHRWVTLDASQPADQVAERAWQELSARL